MSKNVPVNICLEIIACWDMGKFCIWPDTRVCIKRRSVPVMCIYLPLHWRVVTVSADSVVALLTSVHDSWCHDTHSIWNPCSGSVMECYHSTQETADTHFTCGRANSNSQESHHLYTEHYPQCRIPSYKLFTKLHQQLSKSRPRAPRASDCRKLRSVSTPSMQVRISRIVAEDPATSMQRIAAADGIGFLLLWRILHKQSLYSYHIQRVQGWLLAKCVVNTQFVANILFTDEAGFTGNGTVNSHSTHVCGDGSSHTTVAARHQYQLSINVWVGILGDQLLGSVVLPKRLTGAVHHCFLVNDLPVLL